MSEKGEALSVCERETAVVGISSYCFGADSISEEVVGFSPLWFPQGKLFVSLVSCFIAVHVILSEIIMLA